MSLFDYDYEKAFEGDETVTVAKPDATVATADGEKIDDVTDDVANKETVAAATTAASNTATESGRAKNPKGKKKAAKHRRSVKEDGEVENPAEVSDDELAGMDDGEPSDAVDKEMDPASAEEDGEVENPDEDEAEEVPAADAQPAAGEPALAAQPAPDDTIANAPTEMPAADVAAAITPAEKAEDAVAAQSATADDVTTVQAAPAIDECKEQANFFCLEQVKVNMAFDKVDEVCTEAWVKAGTDYQKAVVTENFSESVKKFVVRFKAFCVRMKNLLKRTAIRVMNYIKRVFVGALAKITAKLGGKTIKATKEDLNSIEVKTYGIALNNMPKTLSQVGLKLAPYSNKLGKFIEEFDTDKVHMNDEELKSMRDDWAKEKENLKKEFLGEEVTAKGGQFGSPEEIVNQIKNYKEIFNHIISLQKVDRSVIETVEKKVSSAKDLDTKDLTVKLSAINLMVSMYTYEMSVLNQAAIIWLRARLKVAFTVLGRAGKNKVEHPFKKEAYEGNDLLTQYMSMI